MLVVKCKSCLGDLKYFFLACVENCWQNVLHYKSSVLYSVVRVTELIFFTSVMISLAKTSCRECYLSMLH
jgi:hypothetical protein